LRPGKEASLDGRVNAPACLQLRRIMLWSFSLSGLLVMDLSARKALFFCALACALALQPYLARAAEQKVQVQILSPKDKSKVLQEQDSVLVTGKVATQEGRTSNVDIFFVLDISGSTARYAGVDFGDAGRSAAFSPQSLMPQITIFGAGLGNPPMRNLRNSILMAEVAATRRLLTQLDPVTSRVGLITFSEDAKLVQPLTHDFDLLQKALEQVAASGPYGGTNMVEGIRLAIKELGGVGRSERRADSLKVQLLLTDGFPTMPIGGGRRVTSEDTDLAINAARISGRAGIKVHVFALGEEALSYPKAAVGIARESGGVFTPVVRSADILGAIENISVVGVDFVQIFNETTGQKASQMRLAPDGFFSAAVPVTEGENRIEAFARASDGSNGRHSVTISYERGRQRSLDLEVFIEREKSLKLEIDRLGKSKEEIQRDIDRSREESLKRPQQLPPAVEGPPR
jgi:Mg-chelatase subunit ChlD